MGERSVERMPVEPAARKLDGVSLEAVIGTCGSPSAALVVVEGWT
jgi:hypothetical protein